MAKIVSPECPIILSNVDDPGPIIGIYTDFSKFLQSLDRLAKIYKEQEYILTSCSIEGYTFSGNRDFAKDLHPSMTIESFLTNLKDVSSYDMYILNLVFERPLWIDGEMLEYDKSKQPIKIHGYAQQVNRLVEEVVPLP